MRIHLIAIGGSVMHNLALALKQMGHQVSGSDDEIFEPSRSRLEAVGLLPEKSGWQVDRIGPELDAVILGMHARKDNPELQRAQELNLPLYSFPEFLYQQSRDKTRIVIAGSHGKTTITAMVLHVLHFHERECDYMVGAQLEGFETMVSIRPENEFILLEGDEYLSSPLDPRPKFYHYQPNIALLSGIAWDHYNVFPEFAQYRTLFGELLNRIQPGGVVIYNQEDQEVVALTEESVNEVKKFPYGLPAYRSEGGQFILESPSGDVPLSIIGRHNMSNLEGARWICNQMGLTDDEFYEAIPSFSGASMRLEKIIERQLLTVYRDYAHAPSKVSATMEAVQEAHPGATFLAVLELHTYSSLNQEFMPQYQGSLDPASQAWVYFNPRVLAHKRLPALSPGSVRQAFAAPALQVCEQIDELATAVSAALAPGQETVLLLMSSGNFDGLNWSELLGA